MPRFKEQAVCIRMIDWSETSQIVAMLTENRGKLRGIAKGSKRMSPSSIARFSGGLELLTQGQAVGMIRPSSDLANLTEWDLQQPFRHLRENLQAQQIGLYAADLVNAMLADHDPHPNVFAAMIDLLGALKDEDARAGTLLQFQWRLLEDCGYRPQVEDDAITGKLLPKQETYLFDAAAGGVTAADRRTNGQSGPWRVRRETVEVLGNMNSGDIDASPEVIDRANRLLCVYMRAILDRQLPTMNILLGND
jgi:DNA repair protein RecO (recombination protein O)